MKNQEIKYVIYLRKSTDTEDRQIQSIEDQKKELDKFVRQFNLNVISTFQENKSAKAPGRPAFNEMLSEIRKGKAQGILCWKINRLARNPVDGGEIQWLLQQGTIKSIMTPGREYRTEDNVMMMSVELGMANQFILDLSKDVKRGLVSKAEKGWRPGLAPIGYLNDKFQEKGKKRIMVDEEKFFLVRKMWDMLLSGNYTVPQIADTANDKWGLRASFHKKQTRLSLSHVYRIFTNIFYYGEYDYAGKIYQGKHKSMITPQEFDLAQKILGQKGKPRPKNKKLPFNGIIRCGECGCSITAEEKTKYVKNEKKIKSYLYHKCTKRKRDCKCKQKPINHEKLKNKIYKILDSITIPESYLSLALEILNKENNKETKTKNMLINVSLKALENSNKKIDNLIKLYISPENSNKELLSDGEFKSQKESLIKEKLSIQNEIEKIEEKSNEWMELAEKTFKFATYAKTNFEKGDYEEKTQILRALGSDFTLKDQKLTFKLAKSYTILQKSIEKIKAQNLMLELSNFSLNKTKTASFETISAILSG